MAPSSLQHRRTHNLLLIAKLLNQRDSVSPFTLILDCLEQSARPLLAEFVKRANASKVQTIFVSLETLRKPRNIDVFIPAWRQGLADWRKAVLDTLRAEPNQKKLLIIDSLNSLAATESTNLPGLLSSFISPTTSLLAIYHTDVPLPLSTSQTNPYSPTPLNLLKYLATTIFTTHALHHVLARKKARDRSHAEPSFGLAEGIDGIVQGVGSNGAEGLVLEMEHRRKSGRGVKEWYFLPLQAHPPSSAAAESTIPGKNVETVTLLEDHPLYRSPAVVQGEGEEGVEAQAGSTFELGLTEKQRRDRDGVVLPYFDAQKGGAEGGRILYDMGSEDDFDEEEDEI